MMLIYQPIGSIIPEYPINRQSNHYDISLNNNNDNNNSNNSQNDLLENSYHHHIEKDENLKHYKSRSPRIPFTRDQIFGLERKFQKSKYLSGWEVKQLAINLNLTETRVKIWFQNRRARERRDSLEMNLYSDSTSESAKMNYSPLQYSLPKQGNYTTSLQNGLNSIQDNKQQIDVIPQNVTVPPNSCITSSTPSTMNSDLKHSNSLVNFISDIKKPLNWTDDRLITLPHRKDFINIPVTDMHYKMSYTGYSNAANDKRSNNNGHVINKHSS
ncbi:unnamed protein product [Heterobilharzia americana]|nr:unnamed protein product [Heterobilharzia americana]